jgi:hypothetical protein
LAKQLVAPIDGGAQRLLACGRVARARAQRTERGVQAFGYLGGGQQRAASGGQLDRQRQPIDAAADLCDGSGVLTPQAKARVVASRALAEQRDGVNVGQRIRRCRRPGLGQRQR